MDALVAVLVVLAVIVLLAVVLDRLLTELAERKAAAYLASPFGRPPVVRFDGGLFVVQAARGRYDQITVSGGGLRIGAMSGATLHARVRGACLPLAEVLGRRARELRCEQVDGEIMLPYAELARVSRIPFLILDYVDGRLVAAAKLPVPGIGSVANISGEAVLTIIGNGEVWLRLRGVAVAGIGLPRRVLDQLLGTLSVPIPLRELPYGLRLTELRATPVGLLVCGRAETVIFRRTVRQRPVTAVPE